MAVSPGYFRFNKLFNQLGSGLMPVAGATAIALFFAASVRAKTPQEIADIAVETTVQINDNQSQGGSGVIIARQGNKYTILTANHVVCNAIPKPGPVVCRTDISYTIRTNQGKDYALRNVQRLQKSAEDADLAVVTFESAEEYSVATLGDSEAVTVGAPIYVFGYPALQERSGADRDFEFSPGFVTSRPKNRPQGYTLRYNAVTKGGMSGGPVFDSEGRVVGIHGQGDTEGLVETSAGTAAIKTGFNAGIPIATFMAIAPQIGQDVASVAVDTKPASSQAGDRASNPNEAERYYVIGLSRYDEGDNQGAIAALTQAVQSDPKFDRAFVMRSLARFKAGDRAGALEDVNKTLEINPNSQQAYLAYMGRAWLRAAQGDYQGAIADANQGMQLSPSEGNAYHLQGLARAQLQDYAGAIQALDRAIQLEPNNAANYVLRGGARAKIGEAQRALEDLKMAERLYASQGKTAESEQVTGLMRLLQETPSSPGATPGATPAPATGERW